MGIKDFASKHMNPNVKNFASKHMKKKHKKDDKHKNYHSVSKFGEMTSTTMYIIIGVIAVIILGVGGFLYYKKKKHGFGKRR